MELKRIGHRALSAAAVVLVAAGAAANEGTGGRESFATAPAPPTLPRNLEFGKELRPLLDRMGELSPTFRRQCVRLAAATELKVVLHLGGLPETSRSTIHALTRIETGSGGVARADVWLRPGNLEQHIAHELEHVIERLDGVRVERMAAQSLRGVERVGDAFETLRAQAIGVAVKREVEGSLQARRGRA